MQNVSKFNVLTSKTQHFLKFVTLLNPPCGAPGEEMLCGTCKPAICPKGPIMDVFNVKTDFLRLQHYNAHQT